MSSDAAREPVEGDGYTVASLDGLGEGYGFRKIRPGLGVTEFGINAIVMPPGYETGFHLHERQQELYLVLEGAIEIEFGDGAAIRSSPAAWRASTLPYPARSGTPATVPRATSSSERPAATSAATGSSPTASRSAEPHSSHSNGG